MTEIEDCIRCGHPWSSHSDPDFGACDESGCKCGCYWNSEDHALAHADEWLAQREQEQGKGD